MRIFTTALWTLCSLLHLSEEYEEPACSSINGSAGIVFRVTGRGFTYVLNKGYATYTNKNFNMSFSITNINKTFKETSYWIKNLQLINNKRDKTFQDFDVNMVPETKCLNISVKDKLATMQGGVICRNITHGDLSQNCTIVAKMPWYFQLQIVRSGDGKSLITKVCNSTDNCTLPVNTLTTEFKNCSPQQATLCKSEESRFRESLKNLLGNKLKNVCSIVRFLINTELNEYTKKVDLLPNIINDIFWVDLTMPEDPFYNTTYVQSCHKGDVHWYLTNETYPIGPLEGLDLNTVTGSSMAYLWISKNAVKALLKGFQIHGKIRGEITAENMGHTSGLNTTCQRGVCVGRLVPSLAERYPNCYLDLDLYSLETPDIEFKKDLLIVTIKIIMFAYVRDPNRKVPRVGIASLIGEVSMQIKVSITNNTLHGKIDAIDPNLENVNSTLSDFNLQTVNFILRSAVIVTIEPLFNKHGEKGVEIPIVHAHMYNSSVKLIQDAVIIGFDIEAFPNQSGTD